MENSDEASQVAKNHDCQNSSCFQNPVFMGTENPRQLRVLRALLSGPKAREEVDRAAGASNGPDVIATLRRRGLDIPCDRVRGLDRDGAPITFGLYSLTSKDSLYVMDWLFASSRGT